MDILNFETKIKDMELKYQTQLDSQKIKADADINKLILGGEVKSLMDAEKSTKNLQQEIEGLNGQDAGRQTSPRSEPIAKG